MRRPLLSLVAVALAGAGPVPAAPMEIALDVGHSRALPGALSARGIPEFEFNLELARATAIALERAGLSPRLIGADGLADNLPERARRAGGAHLLVSIHHDAVQPEYLRTWRHGGETRSYSDRYRGHSLFISSRNPHEARSLFCASRIGRALRQAGFAPTRHHAEPIEGENRPWADHAAGVHYYDNLALLKAAEMPAVLFEAGIIVNRREETRLADASHRAHMAEAVARGILACLPR